MITYDFSMRHGDSCIVVPLFARGFIFLAWIHGGTDQPDARTHVEQALGCLVKGQAMV